MTKMLDRVYEHMYHFSICHDCMMKRCGREWVTTTSLCKNNAFHNHVHGVFVSTVGSPSIQSPSLFEHHCDKLCQCFLLSFRAGPLGTLLERHVISSTVCWNVGQVLLPQVDTGEDLCNFYLISDTVYAPVQGTMTYTNATHYNLYNVTLRNQYRPSLYTAVLPLQTLTVYSCPSSTDPHCIQLSLLYRLSLYTAVSPLQTLTVYSYPYSTDSHCIQLFLLYRPSLYTAVPPLQTLTVYSCSSSTDPHCIQLSFLYRPSLYTAVPPLQTLTVYSCPSSTDPHCIQLSLLYRPSLFGWPTIPITQKSQTGTRDGRTRLIVNCWLIRL